MPVKDLSARLARIRGRLADPGHDPEALQDDLHNAIVMIERHGDAVPADLREAFEVLQAEVFENRSDNLPV